MHINAQDCHDRNNIPLSLDKVQHEADDNLGAVARKCNKEKSLFVLRCHEENVTTMLNVWIFSKPSCH